MMQGPIEMVVTASLLHNWRADEEASYEDHDGDPRHIYNILGRAKSKVILKTPQEVRSAIVSAIHHGDAGGWDDRFAYRAALHRFSIRLMAAAREEGIR